jgi:hypothetical protein
MSRWYGIIKALCSTWSPRGSRTHWQDLSRYFEGFVSLEEEGRLWLCVAQHEEITLIEYCLKVNKHAMGYGPQDSGKSVPLSCYSAWRPNEETPELLRVSWQQKTKS